MTAVETVPVPRAMRDAYLSLIPGVAGLEPCPDCGTPVTGGHHPPQVSVVAVADQWQKGYGTGYVGDPVLRLSIRCRTPLPGLFRRRCGNTREVEAAEVVGALNAILASVLGGPVH